MFSCMAFIISRSRRFGRSPRPSWGTASDLIPFTLLWFMFLHVIIPVSLEAKFWFKHVALGGLNMELTFSVVALCGLGVSWATFIWAGPMVDFYLIWTQRATTRVPFFFHLSPPASARPPFGRKAGLHPHPSNHNPR